MQKERQGKQKTMEIFKGKGLGTDRKQKPEVTDIRTCYYFQHHRPTTAALHNKLLMEQQQDWEDAAAVEQLWEHSSYDVREQGQAVCCAAFQISRALTNSAALSLSREEFVQENYCPS